MKMKQKLIMIVALFGLASGLSAFMPQNVGAVDIEINCSDGSTVIIDSGSDPSDACPPNTTVVTDPDADPERPEESCDPAVDGTCCGDVKTSIIGGELCGESDSAGESGTVYKLLIGALNILTAGIGIAAVGGIAYGALLYTTAENKPDQTKKAIGIITNVVIGLVSYALMYLLLNFLIPGGIFTS